MGFTNKQYITGIRALFALHGITTLTLDPKAYGLPEDIPTWGRSVNHEKPISEIRCKPGTNYIVIVSTEKAEQGYEYTFRTEGREDEDFRYLFETVYVWNNDADDPEPEQWLEELFRPKNRLWREFLAQGRVLEADLLPHRLTYRKDTAELTVYHKEFGTRIRCKEKMDCAWDAYIQEQDPSGGNRVTNMSNYGYGTNVRSTTPGALKDALLEFPEDDAHRVLFEFITKRNKSVRAVSVVTLFPFACE